MASDKLLITDIPSRLELLDGIPGAWRSCPYSTGDYSGVMISCGESPETEPLTVRLGVSGYFRIYLGIFKIFEGKPTAVRVRLTNDKCFSKVQPSASGKGSDTFIYELPWKEADLTGQDLILAGEAGLTASLACIRLEPVAVPRQTAPEIKFPMAITEDGVGAFCTRKHRRPEDLFESLAGISDYSCMKVLLWCIGGADLCNYPTRSGTYFSAAGQEYLYSHYKTLNDNLKLWAGKSWDSMNLMKKYAEERKWEFHVSMRMEAFAVHFPFDKIFHSDFFYSHPEWRCIDEKGNMIGRMSYAYEEVQEHMLEIMKEILEYDPDGINLIFTRGMPLVLYEPVMRDGFRKKYGADPLSLDENDASWLKYKAEVITGFVRKAKALLKPGQRLSAFLPADEKVCAGAGLDIACWVRERLIDDVYPTGYEYDEHDVHRFADSLWDIDYFLNLKGRENIRIFPTLFGYGDKSRKLLLSFLENGADGYCLWDGAYGEQLHSLHQLGLENLSGESREAPRNCKKVPLLRLGDFRI